MTPTMYVLRDLEPLRAAIGAAARSAPRLGLSLLLLTPAIANGQPAVVEATSYSLEERIEMMFRYMEIPGRIRSLDLLEPRWLADGTRFWYATGAPDETVIYLVDPVANTRVELFDRHRLRGALEARLGQALPGRGLPFDDFSFAGEGEEAVRFTVEGVQYRLELSSYSVRPLEQRVVPPPSGLAPGGRWYRDIVAPYFSGRIEGVPSPDGKWLLEEDDANLWLRSTADDTRVRLTSDGTAEYPWHLLPAEHSYWGGPPFRGHWSPDGNRIAVYRSDHRDVPRKPVVHWNVPFGHPLHEEHRVRAVADVDWELAVTPPFELHVGELGGERVRWVKVSREPVNGSLGGFQWRPDGSELWFTRELDWSRRLELLAFDPVTGATRTVLAETTETFVDNTQNERYDLLHFVEGGDRFIWRSNRDGWYDLYLYDVEGTLVRRLTDGPFEVSWPYAVDEDRGWIYFGVYGAGPRPYDMYVHRVRLDGSGFQRLTDRNGQPGPFGFSPSRQFFLLYSSTPTSPEVVELWRADGTRLQTLARDDVDWLVDELAWMPPEEFVVKAADGETDLHGLLFKPWDFDPRRQYPVVQVVYGNPSFNFHAFSPWFGNGNRDAPALAQLGFITFVVEERGTHGRGRAFRDVIYRDLAHPKVADHVATLRQLAAERPYMDLSRVGVVGGSYGGIATIRNMLLAPDAYHVGVARSSRWFKWQERLYGAPYHEIPEIYERNSSLTYIENLKGQLLLAHATDDDIEEVMILIGALTDAGKFFDLLILPRGGHSLTETHPRYFPEAQARYLANHLKP
jgi:dipeptidyl aminopeptidase/acylaminoacyl peptidase